MGLLSKNRDFSLISRILNNNDRDAADELVTQYYKAVYKHIYIKLKDEELSMDLTQETFISALKGLGGFNIEKASFKTWLTRIADNKVTDYFRSRQYHESIVTQIMDDTIQEPADERAGTETSVLGKLSYEEMEKMYGHHQNKEWETFRLKVYEGYTFGEISANQGVDLSTVKSRYYAMVKRVRKEWDYLEYPDKEKIRIQIDEILDKSELFDATEDKSSTYTNDKIVQLKPVKQHLPVGKYISVAAAIAAIVIFVISVKNYQTVGRGEQSRTSFVPLATSSSEADMHESTAEEATVKQSQISDMIIEDYNSYEMLYSKLNVMSEGTINIENRTEYGYTYSVRTDNVATRNNVVLYIDVPYDIKYNDKQLDGMDEAAADTLKQVIQTYIDKNGLNSNIKISCYIMNNSLEFYSGDTVYGSLTLSTE